MGARRDDLHRGAVSLRYIEKRRQKRAGILGKRARICEDFFGVLLGGDMELGASRFDRQPRKGYDRP